MIRRSRLFSRLCFLAGALLLLKGSFSVYPYVFPSQETEVAILEGFPKGARFRPGAPLFKLSFPRQDEHFTVVEGTTDKALRQGPGHLEGSPLPGVTGNAVIAGHRDTHFRVLKDVLIGDEIHVDMANQELVYRVVDVRIVSPKNTEVLRPREGRTLTLITCYPFYFLGPAPDRYIVQARMLGQ
jgi:sortase A